MSEDISMSEAVQKAISTVKELLANDQLRNVALEEIEKDKPVSGDWLITVGYDIPKAVQKRQTAIPAMFIHESPLETERKNKIMRINRHGEFVSMKIREA